MAALLFFSGCTCKWVLPSSPPSSNTLTLASVPAPLGTASVRAPKITPPFLIGFKTPLSVGLTSHKQLVPLGQSLLFCWGDECMKEAGRSLGHKVTL